MQKYALLLAYDGQCYKGFQIQINGITIQEKLEASLFQLTGENSRVFCAGRTDSGVHACGQVVSFLLSKPLSPEILRRGLNAILPYDIRVMDCTEVPESFNPRQDAINKTYTYILNHARVADPFMLKRSWHIPWQMDLAMLKSGAACFEGSHNFRHFAASGCTVKTFCREIFTLQVEERQGFVLLHFTADGFLYNMVRIITGTLIECASGKLTLATIQHALNGEGSRNKLGQTAPPYGLYLRKVTYPKPIFFEGESNGGFYMW